MSFPITLPPSHEALLVACAERLQLTPEEALERAVTRMHCALFTTDAEPTPDMTRSAASLTGPDVEVRELPGLSR